MVDVMNPQIYAERNGSETTFENCEARLLKRKLFEKISVRQLLLTSLRSEISESFPPTATYTTLQIVHLRSQLLFKVGKFLPVTIAIRKPGKERIESFASLFQAALGRNKLKNMGP
jgi:hypothetical protein